MILVIKTPNILIIADDVQELSDVQGVIYFPFLYVALPAKKPEAKAKIKSKIKSIINCASCDIFYDI
jgi:hypothetical protein